MRTFAQILNGANSALLLSQGPRVPEQSGIFQYSNYAASSPVSASHLQELAALSFPKLKELEREARYLMRLSDLERHLNLESLPRLEIFQAYFPKRMLQALINEVFLKSPEPIDTPREMFTSARIRRVSCGEEMQFVLELKGSKRGARRAKIERPEVSIEIDRNRFFELLPNATRGFVDKTRYSVQGSAFKKNGDTIPLTAHIDVIIGTGKVRDNNRIWIWKPNKSDFASIDIELAKCSHLRCLRKGRHSFEFLKDDAVELAAQRKELRRALSNTRIAAKGVDRRARKALKKILAA